MVPRSALIGVVLTLGLSPTNARDIYSNLRNVYGGSCCDDHDCQPALYRVTATGVFMQVDGHWFEVPSETIQYRALPGDDGKTGGGHWCGFVYGMNPDPQYRHYVTRCAILPPQAASSNPISLPFNSR
jgi:hypothetical protein